MDAIEEALEKPHISQRSQLSGCKEKTNLSKKGVIFVSYLCIYSNIRLYHLFSHVMSLTKTDHLFEIWGFPRTEQIDWVLFLFAHVVWLVQMTIVQKTFYLIFWMFLIIYNETGVKFRWLRKKKEMHPFSLVDYIQVFNFFLITMFS